MNRNLCGIAAHWYGKAAAQGDEEAGARPCEPASWYTHASPFQLLLVLWKVVGS